VLTSFDLLLTRVVDSSPKFDDLRLDLDFDNNDTDLSPVTWKDLTYLLKPQIRVAIITVV